MLLTREEYYQDVSRHRRDIAILSSELNAGNKREPVYTGPQHVACDGIFGTHLLISTDLEEQAPVRIKPKPSKVFGYVDVY